MKLKKKRVSPEYLWEHFDYDPINGNLIRKKGRVDHLGIAGGTAHRGYKMISIFNHKYLLHRIIWLWLHGSFDDECIDHIDGDTSNNSITNLRCVSLSTNQQNNRITRNETKDICKQELPEQTEPACA